MMRILLKVTLNSGSKVESDSIANNLPPKEKKLIKLTEHLGNSCYSGINKSQAVCYTRGKQLSFQPCADEAFCHFTSCSINVGTLNKMDSDTIEAGS